MYIAKDLLCMIIILFFMCPVAYIFALRFQLKETERELWKERDKNREYLSELSNYKHNEILNKK